MDKEALQHLDAAAPLKFSAWPTLFLAQMPLLNRLAVVQEQAEYEFRRSPHTKLAFPPLQHSRTRLERLLHTQRSVDVARTTTTSLLLRTQPGLVDAYGLAVSSPIYIRLPVPVCIQIARNLDLRDRVSFAQVCRTSRNGLLSEPTLWNRLKIPFLPNYNLAILDHAMGFLSRVRPTSVPFVPPLHVSAAQRINPLPEAACIDALGNLLQSATSFRVELVSLSWELDDAAEWWRHEDVLWTLMCQEAPSLQRLSLTAPSLANSITILMTSLPREFLGEATGQLQSLYLQNIIVRHNVVYPALAGLREFNYVASTYAIHDVMSSSALQGILCNMPQLERFGLASVGFALDTLQPVLCHHRLDNVKTEHIWTGLGGLAQFFRYVPKVQFSGNHEGGTTVFDHRPQGDIILFLVLGEIIAQPDIPDPPYTLRLRGSGTWTPGGSFITSMLVPNVHADRIVSLSMREDQWNFAHGLPRLPRLCNLSIVLRTCFNDDWSDLDVWWNFNIPAHDKQPWQTAFDNLRNITLYSGVQRSISTGLIQSCLHPPGIKPCCCSNGYTISLRDVTDFVRSLQLPDDRRLSRLLLCGFDAIVDVEPGISLCALLKLVDDVDAEDITLPGEFRVGDVAIGERLRETQMTKEMHNIFDGMDVPIPNSVQ